MLHLCIGFVCERKSVIVPYEMDTIIVMRPVPTYTFQLHWRFSSRLFEMCEGRITTMWSAEMR